MLKKVKKLEFSEDSESEMKVFNVLETARYYQTRFIMKLVMDFCKQYNINEKTPPDIIRNLIKLYTLSDTIPYHSSSLSESSVLSSLLSAITTSGKTLITDSNNKGIPTGALDHSIQNNLRQSNIGKMKKTEEKLNIEDIEEVYEYLEDEDDDDGLTGMVNGFKQLL